MTRPAHCGVAGPALRGRRPPLLNGGAGGFAPRPYRRPATWHRHA